MNRSKNTMVSRRCRLQSYGQGVLRRVGLHFILITLYFIAYSLYFIQGVLRRVGLGLERPAEDVGLPRWR